MTDRAAPANDRAAETQGQKGLNVVSAGLDPCNQGFNDEYRQMLKSQLGKISGEKIDEDLLDKVEDRLGKNSFKIEDIANDPENYQSAIGHAFSQAKDSRVEEELF